MLWGRSVAELERDYLAVLERVRELPRDAVERLRAYEAFVRKHGHHLARHPEALLALAHAQPLDSFLLEDRHLMTCDRRLAITTEVREIGRGQVHAHVICWLPNPTAPDGKDKLDACVFGYGETIDAAAKQGAEVWFRCVGAPVLSCLSARPVLGAGHFEGNEGWGVPGGHGFVGPLVVRGRHTMDLDVLAQGNAFQFDGYPRDERIHLVTRF
jgi:hypothetical protein